MSNIKTLQKLCQKYTLTTISPFANIYAVESNYIFILFIYLLGLAWPMHGTPTVEKWAGLKVDGWINRSISRASQVACSTTMCHCKSYAHCKGIVGDVINLVTHTCTLLFSNNFSNFFLNVMLLN